VYTVNYLFCLTCFTQKTGGRGQKTRPFLKGKRKRGIGKQPWKRVKVQHLVGEGSGKGRRGSVGPGSRGESQEAHWERGRKEITYYRHKYGSLELGAEDEKKTRPGQNPSKRNVLEQRGKRRGGGRFDVRLGNLLERNLKIHGVKGQ